MPTSRSRECQRCHRPRAERFFSGPRARFCADCLSEARKRASKDRRLRQTYGITLDEFEALKEAQRGSDGEIHCAGCLQTRAPRYPWSVDHDHRIENLMLEAGCLPQSAARQSIRGLLCRRCNKVLRDVRDDWQILSTLVDYLHWGRDRVQAILGPFLQA